MALAYTAATGYKVNVNSTTALLPPRSYVTDRERFTAQTPEGESPEYRLHPVLNTWVEIDPEQAWFWSEEWQAGERKVDEDLRLGRYEDFDDMDDFIASL